MRVVSWNVNSVRARLPRLLSFLRRHDPDVVCLQETKVTDDEFPLSEIEPTGYQVIKYGQQAYNGVAILFRDPDRRSTLADFGSIGDRFDSTDKQPPSFEPTDVTRGFPDNPLPGEARVISARTEEFRLINVYVVNGGPMHSDRFEMKGQWMNTLGDWIRGLPKEPPVMVVGDFNVAPEDCDVWDPEGLRDRIHCTDEERRWLQELKGERLRDLLYSTGDRTNAYTWWPYQDNAFASNEGLRFDLTLGEPSIEGNVVDVWVDVEERASSTGRGKPSDHAPVIVDLDL